MGASMTPTARRLYAGPHFSGSPVDGFGRGVETYIESFGERSDFEIVELHPPYI